MEYIYNNKILFYIFKDKNLGDVLEKIEGYNSHGLKLCEMLRDQKLRADATINSATNFLRFILYSY